MKNFFKKLLKDVLWELFRYPEPSDGFFPQGGKGPNRGEE